MITVDLQSLPTFLDRYVEVLGQNFVTQSLDSYQPVGLSPHETTRLNARAHPLAKYWFALKADIANSTKAKTLKISPNTVFALRLLSDLLDIAHLKNRDRILDDIRVPNTFASGSFEAYIAANYLHKAKDVEIVPESEAKTCDLRAKMADKAVVNIECKSLEDFAIREDRLWSNFEWQITDALFRNKQCWSIDVSAGREVSGRDFDPLRGALLDAIKRGTPRNFDIECFSVSCKKIADFGVELPAPFIGPPTKDRGVMQALSRFDGVKHYVSNPVIISSAPFQEENHAERIINAIKTASKQLPRLEANILHIEIPYRQGEKLLQVADSAFDPVSQELQRNHSRIKAVVLSGPVIGKPYPPKNDPMIVHHSVIPNSSCKITLPKDFAIFGTNHLPPQQIGPEGTVDIDFDIYESLPAQQGRDLFYYCSADGSQQLRLWQTFKNRFRAQVVQEDLGRCFIEADLNDMAVRDPQRITVTWSVKEMALYRNMVPVTPLAYFAKTGRRELREEPPR